MKKWITGLLLAFIAGYIIAVLNLIIPPPPVLLCKYFGGLCETKYEMPCDGFLSNENPMKDCPFQKYADRNIRFNLGAAAATGASLTVIVLSPEQSKKHKSKSVPECSQIEYDRLWCSSGYGNNEVIPFPSSLPSEGEFVLRFALRDNPTDFTSTIVSK